MRRRKAAFAGVLAMVIGLAAAPSAHATGDRDRDWDWDDRGRSFQIEEATIADIQEAIQRRQITTTDVVKLYLERIKAYNGTCVNEPEGILGPITMIPHAGKLNALMTLNLRPAARRAWGFDERKARSHDRRGRRRSEHARRARDGGAARRAVRAAPGKLVGPLHGVVFAIKDQYDTFDMRTTSGADAFWANDRPPDDATFVARLRDGRRDHPRQGQHGRVRAAADARSSFGGTGCNAYDTERDPGGSSGGSAVAVAANLVTCAIGEETGALDRQAGAMDTTSSGSCRRASWSARTA